MAGQYFDNGPDLPSAKNKLIRCDGFIQMDLNGGAGGSIKLDEGSLSKVKDHSWSIAKGKSNNYVSATIEGSRVAMHRLLLDVVDTEMKLEFVNENRFDLRLKNIRSKSMGNMQRTAERQQADVAVKLKKVVSQLNEAEVRTQMKQMFLSVLPDLGAELYSIAMSPESRGSDKIAAIKECFARGIGPVGEDDPTTGRERNRLEISFVQATGMKDVDTTDAENSTLNNSKRLIPTFGS